MRRTAAAALVLSTLILSGPADAVPSSSSWALTIEPLPGPAAGNSAQPRMTVSTRGPLLSWIERQGDRATLRFSERITGGWTAPRTAASGEDWFVNWADVPSVFRMSDGTLAAHWLQKNGPDTYAYDVRLAYSTDDGRRWSPSFSPHHDGTRTEHGFASLFEMPAGGLGVVWLDGREMKGGDHNHGSDPAGAMSLRFATFDRTWRQTADTPIDSRVCECCPTAAAVTAEGIIAVYRNRGEDETRDVHVSRLDDKGWTPSRPVHDDGWRIPACPVNGPAVSASGRRVAIAWFTMQSGEGRAFLAFSQDSGRTFGMPIRLDDDASLGRVDVQLLPDGSAVATWVELTEGRGQFRVRRVEPGGQKSSPVAVAGLDGGRSSGYPRIVHHEGELTFAWTENLGPGSPPALQVRTAAGRLPR